MSAPRDINPDKERLDEILGTGPGLGIALKNGRYAGRLVPMYSTIMYLISMVLSLRVIYSDDHGLDLAYGSL